MVRNHRLAKAILDVAWGQFFTITRSKVLLIMYYALQSITDDQRQEEDARISRAEGRFSLSRRDFSELQTILRTPDDNILIALGKVPAIGGNFCVSGSTAYQTKARSLNF